MVSHYVIQFKFLGFETALPFYGVVLYSIFSEVTQVFLIIIGIIGKRPH